MDGADAFAVSSSSPLALVRGYFSPATLFVLLNVVIGTIALTSRSHSAHRDDHDDGRHQYHHQQQYSPPPPPAPLSRTSSVMERLRSLGLYRFRSGDFPPEYNHHLSSATSDAATGDASSAQPAQAQYGRSRSEPTARPPPVRRRNKKDDEAAAKKPSSEVKKLERAPAQAEVRRMPRAPVPRAVVLREEAVSVDARADDFINRFRQQLQLQRLNSLLNYREMLNHGT